MIAPARLAPWRNSHSFRERLGRRPGRVAGLAVPYKEEIAEEFDPNPTDKALRFSGNSEDVPENQKHCTPHITDFDLQLARIRR